MTLQRRFLALAAAIGLIAVSVPAADAAETLQPPALKWSFSGPFGKYDRAQLQRGFKVYREVCGNCHGITLLSFRNLAEAGGPGYSVAQATAVAGEYKIKDGPNDQGEMYERAGTRGRPFSSAVPERCLRACGQWRRAAA